VQPGSHGGGFFNNEEELIAVIEREIGPEAAEATRRSLRLARDLRSVLSEKSSPLCLYWRLPSWAQRQQSRNPARKQPTDLVAEVATERCTEAGDLYTATSVPHGRLTPESAEWRALHLCMFMHR
jgi:hypothetical protein